MRLAGRHFAAALVAGSVATQASAATPPRRFETIGLEQGLSNLSVTALARDRDGFLWIGTAEGLNRWDGLEMRVFRHRPGDSESLPSNRISALLVARDGRLWVGTRGGGLAIYDPERERFSSFRHRPNDPESLAHDDVAALAEDGEGRLWAALWRAGLDRIESAADGAPRAVHHRHAANDPDALADDRTRALAVDRSGRLWVGTLGGVHRMESLSPPRFARFTHDPSRADSLADDEIWAVLADRSGSLWAGSWGGGVDRLDELDATQRSARFAHHAADPADPRSLPGARARALFEDRAGTLWIGTIDGGLAELTAAERAAERPRFRVHRHDPSWPYALAGDEVTAIVEDDSGDLWFGTAGGVSRLDRRHERSVYLRHSPDDPGSLSEGGVGGGFEDGSGTLWVAVGHGLDRIRLATAEAGEVEIRRFDPGAAGPARLPFHDVYDIAEDGAGDLFFASSSEGLWRLAARERERPEPRFESVAGARDDPRGLPTNAALSLLVDRRGRLWVGTYRGLHLALRDEAGRLTGFRSFRHDPDDATTLSSDRIAVLAEGRDGAIWVGCYYGLNRLDPESGAIRRFVPDPARPGSLSYEQVLSLHVDESGGVWAGTYGGGLDRFDETRGDFQVFGVREGLPSESVHGIAGDGAGGLWIATARGLAHLDPASGAITPRGVDDGLLDEQLGAVRRLRDGRLLIASSQGLTLLDPTAPARSPSPPPVLLTGLRRFNEPVPVGVAGSLLPRAPSRLSEIVFGPADTQFAFEFAALAFRQPSRHRYRYRLEGHDSGWLASSGADRRAVYSNVPPGRYRFQVVAADESGRWNESGAAIDVVVTPPWWKTLWARVGAALALAGAALGWHLGRVARLRREARRLETKVEERTAELAEANRRLEHASRTDLLTGLPNRRHFLERAESERVATKRSGRPFSILLGDIDRFKSINDTHGHDGGDRVLAAVGTTLREAVRESDLAARWGGEEFIVLLPETELDGAARLAEKIRVTLASLRVLAGDVEIPVTMTIGVAEAAPGEAIDALAARADGALYAGKKNGRNRVELAPPPAA